MIDTEQAHEEWVLMGEPMGSFQAFIFAEWQKTLAEVKRLRFALNEVRDILLNVDNGCDDSLIPYAMLTINEVIE